MKTDELREKYLDFFKSKGHTVCPSDVMVPKWDKSVLFTPAGMNQFKDHFLGKVELEFTRATSSQKCLRTGDIENVGRTAYHHTFFEMLGNFSFGDYFKKDAIHWAWEFLTDQKWLGLDKDRLSVTVYLDDDEAADIWHQEVGLSLKQIQRLDEKENFWPASAPSQGPDGVCGPCSEIFFHPDHGPECEIWNLVFTQFNRTGDPPNNLEPLPSKNIDTGMGLERTAATLQGCSTNFHIDTLMPIVQAAAEICGVKYEEASDNGRRLRRITDHVRACSLAIHENTYPGPQKEEATVRLLLRRAVLQGYDMGLRDPFLYQLVPSVVEQLGGPYPELKETTERVASVIKEEEKGFYSVIERGIPRVEKMVKEAINLGSKKLNSRQVADAHFTHGLPPSVAESVAERNGLEFDWDEYEDEQRKHTEASKSGEKTVMGNAGPLDDIKRELKATPFLGYESVVEQAEVRGLVSELRKTIDVINEETEEAESREITEQVRSESIGVDEQVAVQLIVLDQTPFYGESGGQVGDVGWIIGKQGRFEVSDTRKDSGVFVHFGRVTEGSIEVGEIVSAEVNELHRNGVCRAHSATHILHHALQQNLGEDAQQRGSKVSDDHLRFDFARMAPVTEEQLATIELETNSRIVDSASIRAETLPLEEARRQGAMMLFGEKYPDPVRMVSIGKFSKELCGGIHADNSNEIGFFEIVSEENMSAGTRRIQALTGEKAKEHQKEIQSAAELITQELDCEILDIPDAVAELFLSVKELKKQVSSGKKSNKAMSSTGVVPKSDAAAAVPSYFEIRDAMRKTAHGLNVSITDVANRVTAMNSEIQDLRKKLEQLSAAGQVNPDELIENAQIINGVRVIAKELPGANMGLMRQLIDQIRKKTNPIAVVFLASPESGKVILATGITHDLVDAGWDAGKWICEVAAVVGGRGGGKADMATAGGKNPEKIKDAIETAIEFMKLKTSS